MKSIHLINSCYK